ncbi:hypothetical protein HZC00_05055 [Candidatus Kaiserbacteria bacterium]|nr:hypothetical protein [Candidatus Kaiserbacteria bacterium]
MTNLRELVAAAQTGRAAAIAEKAAKEAASKKECLRMALEGASRDLPRWEEAIRVLIFAVVDDTNECYANELRNGKEVSVKINGSPTGVAAYCSVLKNHFASLGLAKCEPAACPPTRWSQQGHSGVSSSSAEIRIAL